MVGLRTGGGIRQRGPRDASLLVDFLAKQPYVDPARIAFYGLSYGGKSAMRIPPLVKNYCLSIYSAEYADQLRKSGNEAQLNAKPIGTGPFMLKNYVKDAVIRYDVNPQYWGPRPKVDRLIYAITPDPSVRAEKLRAGEL